MAILQVGADGKAPAGAKVGDIIRTAGGDFKITGGTAGDWTSQKATAPSSSGGGGNTVPKPTASSGGGGSTDWSAVIMNPNTSQADREAALTQRGLKEAEMYKSGTWNNAWSPTDELRKLYAPQQQITPTIHNSDDINKMIEDRYAAQQKAALAQSAYAVQQGKSDINSQLQQQLPSYQSMREQSAANTQTDLDNLALRSALQGNRGGIGERQYGVLQASGQDRLLQINLEQKNLEQTAAKQIADLEAQGRFQDAQTVASLAQSKIGELIAEAQNLRNININQEQFNKNFGLQEANLTGYYGGQRTLSGQQFDFSKDTTLADMFGSYNGQQTLAGKQLDFQISDAKFDRAMQLVSGGLTDAQIAADLGVSEAQANQLRNNILAANAKKPSGAGGGTKPKTPTTDLDTLYTMIKGSGQTPQAWLAYYGSKYGITTSGDISNILIGYEDWDANATSRLQQVVNQNNTNDSLANRNSTDNWIFIGGTRYSIGEVERMIDSGRVGAKKLANGKIEYYFK